MPWVEVSTVSARCEFVKLAMTEGVSIRELCRRFSVSPKTAYKWMHRYRREGRDGLENRSRRPRGSPNRTQAEMERAVLRVRDRHPAWGGRKIHARLSAQGYTGVPSASTITAVLKRHGRIDPAESVKHSAFQRFEYPSPNALWQMDFKGHFALRRGRCHPLTILDDHSRFAVGLEACGDERTQTVQERLTRIFQRDGLPERILSDNGPPWGSCCMSQYTELSVWLIRLDICLIHGRPRHPETQGKDERFHRTLKAEVIGDRPWGHLMDCQREFDRWRDVYNLQRPHQALDMAVPASRYGCSPRPFPSSLPSIEYGPDDVVRQVKRCGEIKYRGRTFTVGHAFRGYPVALRPTSTDGLLDVFFCHQRVGRIDCRRCEDTRPDIRVASGRITPGSASHAFHTIHKKKKEAKKKKGYGYCCC